MSGMSIFDAVNAGDIDYVTTTLKQKEIGVDIKEPKTKKTLLMLAAARGDIEIVKLLISNGASVNLTDKDKGTALVYAIAQAPENARNEIVTALLDAGADVTIQDPHHRNALAWTKSLEPVDSELVALVQKNLDEKLAKVFWTVYNPETEKIKQKDTIIALINAGADVNSIVTNYRQEYDWHHNLKYVASKQASILQIAIYHNWPEECLKLILDKTQNISIEQQQWILKNYLKKLSIDTTKIILQKGFTPETLTKTKIDYYKEPILCWLLARISSNNSATDTELQRIQMFLDAGTDPNYMEGAYKPPLILALEYGRKFTPKLLDALLEAGADPLLKYVGGDGSTTTSLDYAWNKFKEGYYNNWKPYIATMAQNVAVKKYDITDPLVLAVVKQQLENIKMLTDLTGLSLANRSDEDCNTLEMSLEKALEANAFLQKYEAANPKITECLTNLQQALRERLSEKEAPQKKGWFSGWIGGGGAYKSLDSGHEEDEPRTIEKAKEAAKKNTHRRRS